MIFKGNPLVVPLQYLQALSLL